jgi:hypothetical protein
LGLGPLSHLLMHMTFIVVSPGWEGCRR